MLSAVLKEKTKTAHQELEKIFIEKIRTITSENDYAAMLGMLYGYFAPLEQKMDAYINADILPDYSSRRKSQYLLNDLQIFTQNPTPPAALSTDELPAIHNRLNALGALYVVEGSTLGGAHICKMISAKLSLAENRGLSYFYSYGSNTHAMWSVFKETLDQLPLSDQLTEEVIKSANETFNGLKKWMKHDKREKL